MVEYTWLLNPGVFHHFFYELLSDRGKYYGAWGKASILYQIG
jgi:hypothetical protein